MPKIKKKKRNSSNVLKFSFTETLTCHDKELLLETKMGNKITSIPQSTFDQVR